MEHSLGPCSPESVHVQPVLRRKPRNSYERLVLAEIAALTAAQRATLGTIAKHDNLQIFLGDYFDWKRTHNMWRGKEKLRALRCLGAYLEEYHSLYKPFTAPRPSKG